MKPDSHGLIAVVFSAIMLSTMGILGKFAFQQSVDPINLVALRAAIAFLILGLGLLFVRRRIPKLTIKHLPLFILLGFIGISLNYASFFLALENTTVSVAISLLYTYPILVVVGAALFLGETFTMLKLIVLVMTLTGCVFITGAYDATLLELNFLGIVFGFIASLTKTVYTLLAKRLVGSYDPWETVFFAFGFGALFLVIYAAITSELRFDIGAQAWMFVIAIAIIPTLIGYSLFVVALKYIESGRASIIATLEPVSAIVLAMLLLGESISIFQIFGIALVIGGTVLLNSTGKCFLHNKS